ncbi:uncharacterized protein LOC121995074 [Zingiber officinale]|uniref:uncharacterized protein LOC121995074 n=1 Tax=Zingiber officinale TaxID=94328 RepID=UPI001C4B4035|nr:uncharacterized protein LOC121995074 [Zingiber officinale]
MEDLTVNYNNIITKFTEYTSVKKSEVDLKQKQLEVEEIKAKAALSKSEAKNRCLKLKEYEILNKDTSQMTKEQLIIHECLCNSSSSSSSTSEDEVHVEIDEQAYDPGEELMLLVLQQHQQLMEAYQRRDTRRRRFVQRNREAGHERLVNDYFSITPVYHDEIFRRRFRMRKELFLHIVNALENHSAFFQQKNDTVRRKGLSPLQKCTSTIRQLAYGVPADHLDEYLRMSESTAIRCLFKFCEYIVEIFGDRYLRRPNADDVQRLLQMHDERHGFPVAWKGQFTRRHGSPTIVLEAVASHDLWIWHAFFGVAGSRNDINVLYESPIFNNVLQGNMPEINFTVNDTAYTKGYYLTDGIYPEWATFVKAFPCREDPKRKLFKERQESARKDVERAFGVLQFRWTIVRGPARLSMSSQE